MGMRFLSSLLVSALLALLSIAPVAEAAASPGGKHHRHRHGHRVGRLAANKRVATGHRRQVKKVKRQATQGQPATPDVLFYGGKINDFAMNQSAPNAVREVADPAGSGEPVMQMTVANSDVAPVTPTSDPRAQLLSPSIIDNGEEF